MNCEDHVVTSFRHWNCWWNSMNQDVTWQTSLNICLT